MNSEETQIPDPKKHQQISFVKSGLRIIAAFCLANSTFAAAGLLFILAELLGIAEEMV